MCQPLRLPGTNVPLYEEEACVLFPLPSGYFHLLGLDGVLRAVNSGVGDKGLP